MENFGIIGSGFGLYGYLPALIQSNYKVVLPIRYKSRFEARKELAEYSGYVKWVSSDELVMNESTGLVLALPPSYQSDYLIEGLSRKNISSLMLEKPIAQTPNLAVVLLDNLIKSRKRFRINYSFRFTDWSRQVKEALRKKETSATLSIDWQFMANHFKFDLLSWKRYNAQGGGVIRYYGIHLISLLAEIGYDSVHYPRSFGVNSDEISKWTAVFEGSGLPKCHVCVDSKSESDLFEIKLFAGKKQDLNYFYIKECDPFYQKNSPGSVEDRRVPFLVDFFNTLDCQFSDEQQLYDGYDKTNRLWQEVENFTVYEKCK